MKEVKVVRLEGMSGLQVGYARADITPHNRSVPTLYDKIKRERKIIDPLEIRTVILNNGRKKVGIITFDILTISEFLNEKIRKELSSIGLEYTDIILVATHTHTAPTGMDFVGNKPMPNSYKSLLVDRVKETVIQAIKNQALSEIGFAKGKIDLSVNRREIGRISEINRMEVPGGLVDPEVNIMQINMVRTGCKIVIFNFAAHPITITRDLPAISADYPGYVCRILDREKGFGQFLQGTCGNINIKIHGSRKVTKHVSHLIAQEILKVTGRIYKEKTPQLKIRTKWVRLPCMTKYIRVFIQALRIGQALFIFLPGEIFVEFGLSIKRELGVKHTFVIAYANNGKVGYIPTREAYLRGGYEVDTAYKYYGVSQLSLRAGEILTEEAIKLASLLT